MDSRTVLFLNRVHYPIRTLGYGNRVGIWFQGCSIRCPGCVSVDTFERTPESGIELGLLMKGLTKWLGQADGVTISGGEPFDQPEALEELLGAIRALPFEGDILLYTGFLNENVLVGWKRITGMVDVLISEPYSKEAGTGLVLRGSNNQKVHLLTELARTRYPENIGQMEASGEDHLQLVETAGRVWFAGIPKDGDEERIRLSLSKLGYGRDEVNKVLPPIRA